MEYDSRSPEAMLAFDIAFEYYRCKNHNELYVLDKQDAYICSIVSINQIIRALNKLNVPEEEIEVYHKAKELLKSLIEEK
jgi:hypothetical protein